MRIDRLERALLTAGLSLAALALPAGATPQFFGLGTPLDLRPTRPFGVSADGSVVVGEGAGSSGLEAFRWTLATGVVRLSDLPNGITGGGARGVSADGSVAVGYGFNLGGQRAVRWEGSSIENLGDLPGGAPSSEAWGVSADGSIVVGSSSSALSGSTNTEAFLWSTATGMLGLGDLPGGQFYSQAWGVSGDGSTVVGSGSSLGTEAFRWTAQGGMIGLGDLPGGPRASVAVAASYDGSTIVGYSSDGSDTMQAFRWTAEAGMVGLGALAPGFSSQATGISADGSLVVGFSFGSPATEAFIWDAVHGMRSVRSVLVDELGLDLTGWTLEHADAISADGTTIVGYGTNPSGLREVWVAVVPEPGTAALLALGLVGLTAASRRQAKGRGDRSCTRERLRTTA